MKTKIIGWFYAHLLKPFFFRLDPEMVHDRMLAFGKKLGSFSLTRKITAILFEYRDQALEQTLLGINFKNPIGLAAGFDKNAELMKILPSVGFGYEEIGSITGESCAGNPKPRLWRLIKSKSLIVYYGLKNDGSEVLSKKLKDQKFSFPIGVSIAKTNSKDTVPVKAGIADYLKVYRAFQEIGDYFTINISCPNAFGGQPFSDPALLEQLLQEIYKLPKTKPIFLKMPPDISNETVDKIISLAEKYGVDGFICSNLTKDCQKISVEGKLIDALPTELGGMSGKIVEGSSDRMIEYIYKKTGKKSIIIGVGGIFNAQDAYRKICFGASLLQLITGMVFQGPQIVGEINRDLVKLLKRDGFKNISEAVGSSVKN